MPGIPVVELRRFRPDPDWFARPPFGIHGLSHETRVLIWTQVLSAMVEAEGLYVDAQVLGWAAAIHDTQRFEDGIDFEHGQRAAAWIRDHADVLPEGVDLERVAYLCEWHVPDDADAPQMTAELQVFKDADALDRWRIGDLDPEYLRTKAAGRLLDASQSLWSSTRHLDSDGDAFEEILQAATAIGVIEEE